MLFCGLCQFMNGKLFQPTFQFEHEATKFQKNLMQIEKLQCQSRDPDYSNLIGGGQMSTR